MLSLSDNIGPIFRRHKNLLSEKAFQGKDYSALFFQRLEYYKKFKGSVQLTIQDRSKTIFFKLPF